MLSLQSAPAVSRDFVSSPDYSPSSEAESCASLAKKVNKHFNGSNYKLITDPEEFIGPYKAQIRKAKDSFDPDDCTFACSCEYNVDQIHGPKMENGRLVFFVHSNSTELPTPRKVTCYNPERLSRAHITQECLPFAK